tara:strand:- start:224 stop:454 length:231 start_codon:yes stop_codon:yes gene_type:complete
MKQGDKVHYEELTEEVLEKFLLELGKSEKKEPPIHSLFAVCKTEGRVVNYGSTNLCTDTSCYWCNELGKEMKKYGR